MLKKLLLVVSVAGLLGCEQPSAENCSARCGVNNCCDRENFSCQSGNTNSNCGSNGGVCQLCVAGQKFCKSDPNSVRVSDFSCQPL